MARRECKCCKDSALNAPLPLCMLREDSALRLQLPREESAFPVQMRREGSACPLCMLREGSALRLQMLRKDAPMLRAGRRSASHLRTLLASETPQICAKAVFCDTTCVACVEPAA